MGGCLTTFFLTSIIFQFVRWFINGVLYILNIIVLGVIHAFRRGNRLPLDVTMPTSSPRVENGVAIAVAIGCWLLVPTVIAMGGVVAGSVFVGLGLMVTVLVSRGTFAHMRRLYQPTAQPVRRALTQCYRVVLPDDISWTPEASNLFIHQLLSACPELMLQIHANHHQTDWIIVDVYNRVGVQTWERIVHAHYPNAIVERASPSPNLLLHHRYIAYFELANDYVAPIRRIDDFKKVDPLVVLTRAINQLQVGERFILTVAVGGLAHRAYDEGLWHITYSAITPFHFLTRGGVETAVQQIIHGQDRIRRFETVPNRVLESKLQSALYHAGIWVQIDAPDRTRLRHLFTLASNLLAQYTNLPYNALHPTNRPLNTFAMVISNEQADLQHDLLSVYDRWRRPLGADRPPTLILETAEMSAIIHMPHDGVNASHVPRVPTRHGISPQQFQVSDGTVIGMGYFEGHRIAVRLSRQDRVSHVLIEGRTRMGKSMMAARMILQDIRQGEIVVVIDPHGALNQFILENLDAKRKNDVVVFDFAQSNHPIPLNLLRLGRERVSRIVDLVSDTFDGKEGPNVFTALRSALITLSECPTATLRDVYRLFWDDAYRASLVQQVRDVEVQQFWQYQYDPANLRTRALQFANPVINRLRTLYANEYLQPTICHSDMMDLKGLMDNNKIILISLDVPQGRVPIAELNLLGEILIQEVQIAGMNRGHHVKPIYLYIDEAERFSTSSLDIVMSQAGKYGISATLIHQYLDQLSSQVKASVLGNVGTLCLFALGAKDAGALSPYVAPVVNSHDLINQNRFEAIVKTHVNNVSQPPFTLETVAPPPSTDESRAYARHIRALSTQRYTPLTRQQVIQWLKVNEKAPCFPSKLQDNPDEGFVPI